MAYVYGPFRLASDSPTAGLVYLRCTGAATFTPPQPPTSFPPAVSIVAARIEQPDRKTIYVWFNTYVELGNGNITVSGHDVGGFRSLGNGIAITLARPLREPITPPSVTFGAGSVTGLITGQDGTESSPFSGAVTPALKFVFTETTSAEPAWMFCLTHFGRPTPPPLWDDPLAVVEQAVTIPAGEWYVANNSDETRTLDDEFYASVSVGGVSVHGIRAKLVAAPVDPEFPDTDLPPGGLALIKAGSITNPVEVYHTDFCTGSAGPPADVIEDYQAYVLGGNVLPSKPATENAPAEYPELKPFSFPLPLTKEVEVNGQTQEIRVSVPEVDYWSAYVLPADYEFGDALPRLPDGLCYLRLARPFVLGGARWDAYLKPEHPPLQDRPRMAIAYVDTKEDTKALIVEWDTSTKRLAPLRSGDSALNIADFFVETTASRPLILKSLKTSGTKITFVMDRELEFGETVTLTVAADKAATADRPPVTNLEHSIIVREISDRNTIVIGFNTCGLQSFTANDHVVINDDAVTITDEESVSKSVYRILMPIGSNLNMPHSHTYTGAGNLGGGPISL